MKNLLKQLPIWVLILTITSCEKEIKKADIENHVNSKNAGSNNVNEIEFLDETIQFEYYLDNQRQFDPNYDLNNDDYMNIIEGLADSLEGEKTIRIYTFTNKNAHNNFLLNRDINVTNLELFEDQIHSYLDSNPSVETSCEDGGCGDYLSFQDSLSNIYLGDSLVLKAPTVIHDNATGGSPAWVMYSSISPFMAPGWNNRTSGINNLNFFTIMFLYDRTFYRNRMATFIGFRGWQIIPLIGPFSYMDNKLSSIIH